MFFSPPIDFTNSNSYHRGLALASLPFYKFILILIFITKARQKLYFLPIMFY
jgi:hypothetical protein